MKQIPICTKNQSSGIHKILFQMRCRSDLSERLVPPIKIDSPLRYIGIFLIFFLSSHQCQSQEIVARSYSNSPIGTNFISGGLIQGRSGSYLLNTQVLSFTRVIDVAGQSGGLTIVLPYAELTGTGRFKGQSINGAADGLSDPLIKASVNLFGAPALSKSDFKNYQQDLIVGASVAATIPWGEYNNNQLINVGANRSLIQTAIGGSQATGPWRLELASMATFFTQNNSYMQSNSLKQNPIYSGSSHAIYYLSNASWVSIGGTYFVGGEIYLNGAQVSGTQENWRLGSTFSYPVNSQNSIRFTMAKGVYSRSNTSYNALGISWQYFWGGS